MQQTNTELAESLHQFVTIWNMIGKPFLRVDQTDRPGLGGTHALQTAHEATGIRRTVLHATEAGYPLYLRLGYRPTGKFMGCMLGHLGH